MNLEEIIKNALDGNAILFLGAGFSVGAQNISNGSYLTGAQLCTELIKHGNIDISGEDQADLSDLGYISQKYLTSGNTLRDLIYLLKQKYTCRSVGDEHKTIASINWKKIYTTNYDDVMEVASREVGKLREPVVATTRISDVFNQKNAVIHINGYIGTVNENNFHSTFKLTEQSYRNRTIPDSEWAIALHNDIKNAKSVIFIGYSLGYDLELQQIFSASDNLKDKCLFITYNPSRRSLSTMEEYGCVYRNGLSDFSKEVQKISENYDINKSEYSLRCLEKKEPNKATITSINANDIIRLLVDGQVNTTLLSSSFKNDYIIERDCLSKIRTFLSKDGKVVILHSDLANGKTIALHQLMEELSKTGDIYYIQNINSSLADDLEYLSSCHGVHYIFYENYNQLLDSSEWSIIKKYKYSNIKYIFTARSYINDNFYMRVATDLELTYQQMAMYDLNQLTDAEIRRTVKYINKYNLWGMHSVLNSYQKEIFIRKKCKKEIRNVLLEIYKSPNVINKVNDILNIVCKNDTCKDILLMAFICNVMSIEMQYDDIESILGYRINELYFEQYKEIKELLLIDGNIIRFKSSSIAAHVIANNNFNEDILRLICKMVNSLTRHEYLPKNVTILKLLISFSNLRMIFNRNDKNIKNIYTRFYENARKTQYYSNNQFFWLQYAIAAMEVNDYSAAEIYLENADAFAKERFSEESYQVENLRARLILEKTLHLKDYKNAFENFEKAHCLICFNKTPQRHYPYRQVKHYIDFYKIFYTTFTQEQKVCFMVMCLEIKTKLSEYLNNKNSYERNERSKHLEISSILSQINDILKKMGTE